MLEPADVASLVGRAASGDQESWNDLVDTFGGLVWSVIRGHRFYGAEAADIFQTVWLRTVEHIGRIREPERFAAWVATTTRHECYRISRRSGRSVAMAELPEVAGDAADDTVVAAALASEDRATVAAALDHIPPRCQVLLRMLAAEPPLSYDEISATLEMPKGSIGPTRARCLNHLKAQLERHVA